MARTRSLLLLLALVLLAGLHQGKAQASGRTGSSARGGGGGEQSLGGDGAAAAAAATATARKFGTASHCLHALNLAPKPPWHAGFGAEDRWR